jgi:hypothetical protein
VAKLIITTKNGRHRKDHEFEIDSETAMDPIKRAGVISAKKALFNNVVNHRIEN